MIVASTTRNTTTFTCGSSCPRWISLKIHVGSVLFAPTVNVVTITSSNESANASRPPEISAVEIDGNVT